MDFANGFLFGELLYKFCQLTNINDFHNKDERDPKIRNFIMLAHTLKNMGIPFSTQAAFDIMNKKPGKASKLLYTIRSKLEKKGINYDNLSLKKCVFLNSQPNSRNVLFHEIWQENTAV